MRRRLLKLMTILLMGIPVISCRDGGKPVQLQPDKTATLNIYFFHLTARCEACTAIEENTRRILDNSYGSQLKNGTIIFRSINIDNRENRVITEKYKISYTSLLLVRADGTVTDFTNVSLNYAFMNPPKFEELLKTEIDKNLE